jgi:hypothetical protein
MGIQPIASEARMKFLTIKEACRKIGGDESPIHPSTFYRGVKAGLYPAPVHVSLNIARVNEGELLEALARLLTKDTAPTIAA